jgi:segregation and condensation protein A
MNTQDILIRTEHFDGPLALLLHLIERDEVTIKEIDMTRLTAQYLDYLKRMQELNFDLAGEYLYMAATLLYLKSQTAIQEPDTQLLKELVEDQGITITSKADLIRQLEQLERFQHLGQRLWALPKKGHEVFVKPKVDRKVIENSILTPVDFASLTSSMIELFQREKRKYTLIKRDRLSIKEKLEKLRERLKVGERAIFDDLLDRNSEIPTIDKVITFISLLELARLNKLEIFQNENESTIYVDLKEDLASFDVTTADGFEPENTAKPSPLNVGPTSEETTHD